MIGIYKITNLITGKVYIGQSKRCEQRFLEHKNSSSNEHLRNSIEKYGVENFSFEILEETLESDLDEREIYYICLYDSTNPDKGYNIAPGPVFKRDLTYTYKDKSNYVNPASNTTLISKSDITTRCKLSELDEYLNQGWVLGPSEKWRAAHRQGGNTEYFKTHKFIGKDNGFYGKHHTEETKQKIRDNMPDTSVNWRGKHYTEESKQKMRGPRPNIMGNKNPNYGKRGEKSPIYGRRIINKDGNEKKVFPEELNIYLQQGWILGRKNVSQKKKEGT